MARITETITFQFDDAAQQKRFHELLDKEPLGKRPVAFRVPDGSGWTLLLDEDAARIEAERRGVNYQGLYARVGA